MHNSALDPAHLMTLNVLLDERSVTRAAERLGISQSSMSHRLAHLRSALGDPLLVRAGSRLVPTARALSMAEPLAQALRSLASVVAPVEPFDPSTSRSVIGIALPDLLAPLVPRLASALTDEAPGVQIRVSVIAPALSQLLADERPNMALTPVRFVDEDICSLVLGELHFGVVGRHDHPALRRPPSTKRWLAHPHVVVRIQNERTNLIGEELARRGLSRRVGLEVPSFLAGLHCLAQSDFLMNVPIPLAHEAAAALGLRLREAPIKLPSLRFALAWHARHQHDPAHKWARERVYSALRPSFIGGE